MTIKAPRVEPTLADAVLVTNPQTSNDLEFRIGGFAHAEDICDPHR